MVERKRHWTLSQSAFDRLLSWLAHGSAGTSEQRLVANDPDSTPGEQYLDIRRRLVAFFDRKNCASPDDLADETLNRVARRLEEQGSITDATPAQFCYITARYIFLEYLRRAEHRELALDELSASPEAHDQTQPAGEPDEGQLRERRMECLERCLQSLENASREMIVRYYRGEQRAKIDNRRALALQLGITLNALTIRACRVRDKLEMCVSKCVAAHG